MIKNGYALVRMSDGNEIQWWNEVPPRIDTPGGDVVFGADVGWEGVGFKLVASDKEFPDPPPPPEPPVLPIIVDASSAKLVLDDDGLYSTVETICRNHPVLAVRIFWESANTWAEDNPYVFAIGTELNLTEEAIHSMFERALLK